MARIILNNNWRLRQSGNNKQQRRTGRMIRAKSQRGDERRTEEKKREHWLEVEDRLQKNAGERYKGVTGETKRFWDRYANQTASIRRRCRRHGRTVLSRPANLLGVSLGRLGFSSVAARVQEDSDCQYGNVQVRQKRGCAQENRLKSTQRRKERRFLESN